jgi:hypothetical protein
MTSQKISAPNSGRIYLRDGVRVFARPAFGHFPITATTTVLRTRDRLMTCVTPIA